MAERFDLDFLEEFYSRIATGRAQAVVAVVRELRAARIKLDDQLRLIRSLQGRKDELEDQLRVVGVEPLPVPEEQG